MHPITIAIADDQAVYREALRAGIEMDDRFRIIADAANGKELLEGFTHAIPDLVIMDIKMPVMDGKEATRIIREQYPSVNVLVVSMYEEEKFIRYMREAGAKGYLLKSAAPALLREAILTIQQGGEVFPGSGSGL